MSAVNLFSRSYPRGLPLLLGGILVCFAATGCRSIPNSATSHRRFADTNAQAVSNVATNRRTVLFQFNTCQKLNPVWWTGNADSPMPPEWYRPGKRSRNFTWHVRNPFHNFTFYVIGIADKPFTRVGRFPGEVSNPNGGWNWAVCRYKCLRLPFIGYNRGRFKFYCGWRGSGNFGMKFNFSEKPKAKAESTSSEVRFSACADQHLYCRLSPY